MIYHCSEIGETAIAYLTKAKSYNNFIYTPIIFFIIAFLISLPHISVKSMGITRSNSERTDVKSTMGGLIKN